MYYQGRRSLACPFSFMSTNQFLSLGCALLVALSLLSYTQASTPSTPKTGSSGQHALELAQEGHCAAAIPLLKKAIPQSSDKDFRRSAALAGVRCAMVKNQFEA